MKAETVPVFACNYFSSSQLSAWVVECSNPPGQLSKERDGCCVVMSGLLCGTN